MDRGRPSPTDATVIRAQVETMMETRNRHERRRDRALERRERMARRHLTPEERRDLEEMGL